MADGLRVRKLTLYGPYGSDQTYEVDFTRNDEWRPLSIIAGRSATGKTSAIEYVLYCLGASDFPVHNEMRDTVAGAVLDIELNGVRTRIERTTTGAPSKFASIWVGENVATRAAERRLVIEPPSDPENLSHFVLESFGLAGIKLPMSESRADSTTQTLSIRDVLRVVYLPNHRLDSMNLVFEDGNQFVAQKFSQTVDLAFGVADDSIADIAERLRRAEAAAREAEAKLSALRSVVDVEYPEGAAGVEIELQEASEKSAFLRRRISTLDRDVDQRGAEVADLRLQLAAAKEDADGWDVKVRDRQSLIGRLESLRLDYSDDLRKLTFLREAERIFDPFHISICPACLNPLEVSVLPHDGVCGLCGRPVEAGSHADPVVMTETIRRESHAVETRLESLVEYLGRLTEEQTVFIRTREEANLRLRGAESAVEASVTLPAPFLAARDSLAEQLADAVAQFERYSLGSRLFTRATEGQAEYERLLGAATAIRRERSQLGARPDRGTVIAALSERFAKILADFGYPKLSEAFIDPKLQPHVRGNIYTAASSGGLTLISLAWYLALWEVAYEKEGNLPGLLIIDSPQKNLGQRADAAHPEFSDMTLVDNFYRHVATWLAGPGRGAQLIVVDNTPPTEMDDDVVVRFSGTVGIDPFGLITDATQ